MSEAFRAEMKQAEEEDILSGSYVFFTAHTHTQTHTSNGPEYKSELLVLFLQTELQFMSEEGVLVFTATFI